MPLEQGLDHGWLSGSVFKLSSAYDLFRSLRLSYAEAAGRAHVVPVGREKTIKRTN